MYNLRLNRVAKEILGGIGVTIFGGILVTAFSLKLDAMENSIKNDLSVKFETELKTLKREMETERYMRRKLVKEMSDIGIVLSDDLIADSQLTFKKTLAYESDSIDSFDSKIGFRMNNAIVQSYFKNKSGYFESNSNKVNYLKVCFDLKANELYAGDNIKIFILITDKKDNSIEFRFIRDDNDKDEYEFSNELHVEFYGKMESVFQDIELKKGISKDENLKITIWNNWTHEIIYAYLNSE